GDQLPVCRGPGGPGGPRGRAARQSVSGRSSGSVHLRRSHRRVSPDLGGARRDDVPVTQSSLDAPVTTRSTRPVVVAQPGPRRALRRGGRAPRADRRRARDTDPGKPLPSVRASGFGGRSARGGAPGVAAGRARGDRAPATPLPAGPVGQILSVPPPRSMDARQREEATTRTVLPERRRLLFPLRRRVVSRLLAEEGCAGRPTGTRTLTWSTS